MVRMDGRTRGRWPHWRCVRTPARPHPHTAGRATDPQTRDRPFAVDDARLVEWSTRVPTTVLMRVHRCSVGVGTGVASPSREEATDLSVSPFSCLVVFVVTPLQRAFRGRVGRGGASRSGGCTLDLTRRGTPITGEGEAQALRRRDRPAPALSVRSMHSARAAEESGGGGPRSGGCALTLTRYGALSWW
jgi:hypothetical protein